MTLYVDMYDRDQAIALGLLDPKKPETDSNGRPTGPSEDILEAHEQEGGGQPYYTGKLKEETVRSNRLTYNM